MMEGYGANGGWAEVWIALDPGISTGWALVADDLKVLGHGVFTPDQVRDGVDRLVRGLHRNNYRVKVVVERLPKVSGVGNFTRELDEVVRTVYEVTVDTYDLDPRIIPPGEWKPSRAARVAKKWIKEGKEKMTQHEKDAIMMGVYAIIKERQ